MLQLQFRSFHASLAQVPSTSFLELQDGDSRRPFRRTIIMPTGTVKFFDNAKGYGFITNEGGASDAFVHISAVEAAGMNSLDKEQRISYDLENDKRGKTSAVNLRAG
jgi:CspA family cold shock protein